MACLLITTFVVLVAIAGLLALGARLDRAAQAEAIERHARTAQRQLFDITARAYRAMLDEARRHSGGRRP